MMIRSAAKTDKGRKRPQNEDALLRDDRLRLYAVADGVGGHEGGEIASARAVATLARVMQGASAASDDTPPQGVAPGDRAKLSLLQAAFARANGEICDEAARVPGLAGMGTTLTAVLLRKDRALICHVGDSRAYLFRAGELRQLTDDHSVVAEQVRAGKITAEEAKRSPHRHVITRALGIDREVESDERTTPVREGDMLLLCTDGLTEMVDDAAIARVLAGSHPAAAVDRLINLANERGGVDNITAVVIALTAR